MAVLAGRRPLWLAGAALTGVVVALTLSISPLVTILLLLMVIGCVVIIARPDIVLLVMVAALPWENKLNWPTATLSLTKAIGAVVFLAYVLRIARSPRRKIHLPLILGVVVVFFCWILLSSVVSPDPTQDMQKTLRYALFISFFFLILQLVDGRVGVERVFRWFGTSVGIAAVYGLVAFVLGVGGVSRAQGPLKDANDFAYLLACALPVVAYLIQTDPRKRLLWGFWFVAILGAMLATFSRGALVGIGALVIWGVLTRRVSLLAVVAGLATAGVVVLMAFTLWKPVINKAFEQKGRIANQNAGSRLSYWAASLKLTARRPITGVGPDRFRVEAPPLVQNDPLTNDVILVPHNTYLDILSETGVPALLLFFAYLGLSWRQMRYVERAAIREGDLDGRRLAVALQAGFVVAIVSAMFLSEQLTSPFWLFPALALVLARELDPHGIAGDLPPPEKVPKAPAPAPRAGQPGPPVPVPA